MHHWRAARSDRQKGRGGTWHDWSLKTIEKVEGWGGEGEEGVLCVVVVLTPYGIGGGMLRGAYSSVACHGNLIIDHASIPFETEHRYYS